MIRSFFFQKIHTWIAIAFIAAALFWIILAYLVHKTQAIGHNYAVSFVGANFGEQSTE